MDERAIVRCNACLQTDDHPKVHMGIKAVWHYDCIPLQIRSQILGAATRQYGARHLPIIIDAAHRGKRGNALVKHIESVTR